MPRSRPGSPRDLSPSCRTRACSGRQRPTARSAPVIASGAELAGAIEHLQYAVFRRYENQLTRAERTRLDNTIENALFKIDRYLERTDSAERLARLQRSPRARGDPRGTREDRAAADPGSTRRARSLLSLPRFHPRPSKSSSPSSSRRSATPSSRPAAPATRGPICGSGARTCWRSFSASTTSGAWSAHRSFRSSSGTIHHTRSHKGFFVTTSTLLACGREVRRRSSHRADRRPETGRAGPGSTRARRRREPQPAWF